LNNISNLNTNFECLRSCWRVDSYRQRYGC